MAATHLDLVTEWRIAAPPARVWAEISTPDNWPAWWQAVQRVEKLSDGDARGVGAVRRFTWGTALPYTLSFNMTSTRIEPERLLEGEARGELDGTGRWTLTAEGEATMVRYDWSVELTRPWQRLLAPVLRPAFAWNHKVVMGWGEAGLKRRLGLS